ncbi:hypothetical protein PAPHI01_0008, partial [Pancytospora philotis]
MDEGRKEHQRRVSFALEPQINYIYRDESNSTKNSSSMNDVPMDMTTDIAEFKNLDIFRSAESNLLYRSIDDLFRTNSIEEYAEDPILVKEYAKRRQSLGRRESLDPLKALTMQRVPVAQADALAPPAQENAENTAAAVPEQLKGADERPAGAETARGAESSFNDTAIGNSSYEVEELVNTVDLRKMLPAVPKESADIDEFLQSIGIRFLDDSITDGMRRDTLSKSRNEVSPALYYHYRYSLKERIDYLYNFSGFLNDKMREFQSAIAEAKRGISVVGLNKDTLKKIRNESRNRSKIDWYNLRRLNELQFNNIVSANRTKLVEMQSSKRREEAALDERLQNKRAAVAALRAQSEEMQQRLAQNNPGSVHEAEKLQRMIADGKSLLDSVAGDCSAVVSKLKELELQGSALDASIARLKDDNERLKKNLMVKSVSEVMLNDAKRATQRYCSVFKLKVVKITKNTLVLNIYANTVTLSINDDCCVTGATIAYAEDGPFDELVVAMPGVAPLGVFLRDLVGKFVFAHALRSEVECLRLRNQLEVFFINQQLHVRVFAGANGRIVDFAIEKS